MSDDIKRSEEGKAHYTMETDKREYSDQPQQLLEEHEVISEAEENRLIRKLDLHLLPLLFVLYSLSVLDRSNLGNARLAGMEEDIDLSGNRYNTLSTIFYVACMHSIECIRLPVT